MKYILLLLCLTACHTANAVQASADSLQKLVVRLSSGPYARNYKHTTALSKTADYIKSRFEKHSNRVVYQDYAVNDTTYRNVIASFGPDTGRRLIIGAHYDVFGEAPGADYNASGVAGLIELSRLLATYQKYLHYRVDLIAYTLSEPPFSGSKAMGSYIHALSLHENKVPVAGMINLDGIGYFTDQPRSQRYPFFPYRLTHGRRGNFIALVQEHGNGLWGRQWHRLFKQYVRGLRVIHFKPAVPFEGFSDGDQLNYLQFGFPTILITDTKSYRNKNYHYDIDHYESLDYFRMANVVDMVYQSIIHYKA